MPLKSEAQRRFLNWKFGHEWTKRHHFAQKGELPERTGSDVIRRAIKARGKGRVRAK